MSLPVSLEILKESVGPVGLTDPALQTIAEAAWAEIIRRAGEPTSRVEIYNQGRRFRDLILQRKATGVTQIRERATATDAWEIVPSTDYFLTDGGNTLTHTSRAWARWVEVSYSAGLMDIYLGVLADLVSLRLPQSGWRAVDESPEDPWGNPTEGSAVTGLRGSLQVAGSAARASELEEAVFARLNPRRLGVA